MARPRTVHLPALVAYVVAVFGLTFPLLIRFTSHMVGEGDCQLFVWELWWFHKAVFELHQNPLVTSLLFFPTPSVPLIWSSPYNIVLGMGLVGWLGPVVTYNVLVTSGLWVAAVGAYFLAWHFTRRRDPLTPAQERTASRDLARAGITHVIVHSVPGYIEGSGYDDLEALAARMFGPPVAGDATMSVHRTHAE